MARTTKNAFLKIAKLRKTTYEYATKDVSNMDILSILEAARWAPSAGNCQPWKFIIVRDQEKINRLIQDNQHGTYPFIKRNPPVLVAFLLDNTCIQHPEACLLKDISKDELYASMGACFAYAILQAQSLGIQSSIITPNPHSKKNSYLRIPKSNVLAYLVCFGYQKKEGFEKDRARHSLDHFLAYD